MYCILFVMANALDSVVINHQICDAKGLHSISWIITLSLFGEFKVVQMVV
jgi:hypothetical protein